MAKFRDKKKEKEIAKERINELFKQADEAFPKSKSRANRYVELARKIAMKTNIRIPKELKRRVCKHCYSYLKPGTNARVRTREGKVIYYCQECKKYSRYPYTKEKKKK